MEHGFYHPNLGYWQTNTSPTENIVSSYPSGTVGVPLKPSAGHEWDGTTWVKQAPNLTQLPAEIRAKRNTLLQQSDWTQVADAPVDQAAWATYRQALRDVTTQVGFPEAVVWPVAPN